MPVMPAITADVADSTATTNTDITNLAFPVSANRMYYFKAYIPYTSAATTTGAEFGVDVPGTATFLTYTVTYASTATAEEFTNTVTDDGGVAATASATTAGNLATVEGFCKTPTAGSIQFRMDTEVGASAITVKAGAFVEYRDLAA